MYYNINSGATIFIATLILVPSHVNFVYCFSGPGCNLCAHIQLCTYSPDGGWSWDPLPSEPPQPLAADTGAPPHHAGRCQQHWGWEDCDSVLCCSQVGRAQPGQHGGTTFIWENEILWQFKTVQCTEASQYNLQYWNGTQCLFSFRWWRPILFRGGFRMWASLSPPSILEWWVLNTASVSSIININ